MSAQRCRSIEVRVPVYGAVSQKFRLLQTGNHSQHPLLFRDTKPRLESNEIPHPTSAVFLAELHDSISFASSAGIAQADRLEWTKPQRISPALGHYFDRHAAFEVRDFIELVAVILIRRDQRVEKRVVLLSRHRAIEIRAFVVGPSHRFFA